MDNKKHSNPKHPDLFNQSFVYHPFELAFCGYSGSGKTTLITKLIQKFNPEYKIGYVKHQAHYFDIDHEGKDTFSALNSGAKLAAIADSTHSAIIVQNHNFLRQCKTLYRDCEWMFIEGFKTGSLPKILILDDEHKILNHSEPIGNIVAVITPNQPPTGVNYPCYHRDDMEGIFNFIKKFQIQRVTQTPLMGLVLAGGRSLRMGQDKAEMVYQKAPQYEIVAELLKPFCNKIYFSLRREQELTQTISKDFVITDSFLEFGPMSGILSAMKAHPGVAWLVIACDLPWLSSDTISHLIAHRNPFKIATTLLHPESGLPEPLITIYEPNFYGTALTFLGEGIQCPRKMLIRSSALKITAPNSKELVNANTPEEKEFIQKEMDKKIHVK